MQHSPTDSSSPASLNWHNGQPLSIQYQDVYFSYCPEDPLQGLKETEHVFLEHNHLKSRWHEWKERTFTIAETGFGTGLNFLCAVHLWLEKAAQHQTLHFISIEKHPVLPEDMRKAHALWPSLKKESEAFLREYKYLTPGFHRFYMFERRVCLTLMIGEAKSMLAQLQADVDAWFLDGFSPAKNPDMWQPALFEHMARLSHPGTTFATFTSAGSVRRGLADAGFEVIKSRGHGKKREMCHGQYSESMVGKKVYSNQAHTVAVIGAGISGCATAYALAQRGIHVMLLDKHDAPAQEASGNPYGVLYPRLASQPTPGDVLALESFLFTLRLLQQLPLSDVDFALCGLLQLAFNARTKERMAHIGKRGLDTEFVKVLSSKEASEIAGIPLNLPALFYPSAGWVNPRAFCEALIKHPNIAFNKNCEARSLIPKLNCGWEIETHDHKIIDADAVVVCNAFDALKLDILSHLPLRAVRGQMTTVASNTTTQTLKTVLCSDGYVTPDISGMHSFGATFDRTHQECNVKEADNLHNLDTLTKMSVVFNSLIESPLSGRAALRCKLPDHLPMAGEVKNSLNIKIPDQDQTLESGSEGLYVNLGHGARGLTTAPYCAEIIASQITHDPLPASNWLVKSLSPNRQSKKSTTHSATSTL